MRFPTGKYNLAGIDRASDLNKLFLFWHAYDEEEELLREWHESTAHGSTNNELLDSFLDTWGEGAWKDVETPAPWPRRTYFQALGVVSHQLRKNIRDNVLNEVLEPEGDKFKLPPTLKEGVDPKYAESLAQNEIGKILNAFNKCEILSLAQIDAYVHQTLNNNCPQDVYLNALLRMTCIETGCFEVQKHFLETGHVISESDALKQLSHSDALKTVAVKPNEICKQESRA
jgi:hypothetical protein